MKSAVTVLICIILSSSAWAQSPPADFWREPGATIRDKHGNVTYAEIKDPKNFTIRVLNNGKWVTHRYAPNSTRLVKIEGGDTVEDLLYDEKGVWDGVIVATEKQKFAVRATDNGVITASGFAPLTFTRDSLGRDRIVKYGNDTVVSVEYAESGHVAKITAGDMVLTLSYAGDEVSETLSANGVELHKRTVTASPPGRRMFPFSFDIVEDRVGAEWQGKVKPKRSATETLITFTGDKKEAVARMVEFGGARVAYDAAGRPLFYDVSLEYNDAGGNVVPYRSVLPERIVITPAGEVGAYLDSPADGAIASLWSATAKGRRSHRFRVFHTSHQKASGTGGVLRPLSSQSDVDAPAAAIRFRPAPLMIWQCGVTEKWHCDSSGSSGYCYNYYEPVYCDSGSGGGTTSYDGGSTGGGTASGNQVTGDAALRSAVTRALTSANAKLDKTECAEELLKQVTNSDGTTLYDVVQQKNTTALAWMNRLTFRNGTGVRDSAGKVPCDSAVHAWTRPSDTLVYTCKRFANLPQSVGGDTLIHEELHTLGLQEKPRYPDAALTSPEIQALVSQHCN